MASNVARLSSRNKIVRLFYGIILTFLAWKFIFRRAGLQKLNEPNDFSEVAVGSKVDDVFFAGCRDPFAYTEQAGYQRQNATFVMLTRNNELKDVLATMRSLERHFNQWFMYPYVFLNEDPFTEEFQERVRDATAADVSFGLVEESDWEFPRDVRQSAEFKEYIADQGDRGIMYGNMESYHKMCRFYSGTFFKHPLVARNRWYWRIEPDVEFFCDITYDPFYEMEIRNKKYAFTVLIRELYWTVPNLFRQTRSFVREHGIKVGHPLWRVFVDERKQHEPEPLENIDPRDRLAALISRATNPLPIEEDKFDNEEYNLCHFWTNFEIARVDIFNSRIYQAYFEHLENSGGFWTERWGDAPVHSLGLALSLKIEDIHYFRDIGYQHSTLAHCPANRAGAQLPYVTNPEHARIFASKSSRSASIFRRFTRFRSPETEYGVGCRCECPRKRDVEDNAWECFAKWYEATRP
ncbi:LAMI_0E03598g1_1 [Lachancea mirantina]|uniref:LAMI_0E03598g1_1 n=1 Tax=Lachancea mirantina TaxID=1230905 RepID=A0A1G4JJT1_9SACH|nr:LAMI_0E03598g1_1 [Lachancea mirantina]